ncbi:hypothetical protein VmeM32_00172 [Vibrio phage vB_VmeM-32]|nr:hypothetical protein VmeM32_00172 [Vibrio phage vB_VmeM-32]
MKDLTQKTMKTAIVAIFKHEDDFKCHVLKNCGWDANLYNIEFCDLGQDVEVTIKRVDGRRRTIYIPNTDVYEWFLTKK